MYATDFISRSAQLEIFRPDWDVKQAGGLVAGGELALAKDVLALKRGYKILPCFALTVAGRCTCRDGNKFSVDENGKMHMHAAAHPVIAPASATDSIFVCTNWLRECGRKITLRAVDADGKLYDLQDVLQPPDEGPSPRLRALLGNRWPSH